MLLEYPHGSPQLSFDGCWAPDPSADPTTAKLSQREEDVLRLSALGHSNKDIGNTLGISVKTVEVHKGNAMQKLDLHGRTDTIGYAHMRGWFTSVS